MNAIEIGKAKLACDDLPYLIHQLYCLANTSKPDPKFVGQKQQLAQEKIAKLADAFGFELVAKSQGRKAA